MEEWVKDQRRLLCLEVEEESSQLADKIQSLSSKACEDEGLSMVNMCMSSCRTELFGRCCVELQKVTRAVLPTGFKVGDEVCLLSSNSRPVTAVGGDEEDVLVDELFGLVKSISQFTIDVVFDDYDDRLVDFPLRLNLRPSLKTHTKMMESLSLLSASPHPLLSLLHGSQDIVPRLVTDNVRVQHWHNNGLNEAQQSAVEICLNASLVSIVHGPVRIIFCLSLSLSCSVAV
jgi:hypothetical protein